MKPITVTSVGLGLSRAIRRGRLAAFLAAIAVFSTVGSFLAISSWLAADSRLRAAQDDFQATWCATFGAESFDASILDSWYAFVERNRDFLEKTPALRSTRNTGERIVIPEDTLDYWSENIWALGSGPDFESAVREFVAPEFWPLDEVLARGTNTFGKPVPLPCN